MNKRIPLFLASLLFCVIISACGPSQAESAATVTQVAANIYATQTAHVPTATQTFTPSPTPTITPTPTPTPTPTMTPTPTRDPSILFIDDFSNIDSGWGHFSDSGAENNYANDGYHIYVKTANLYYWVNSFQSFRDGIVEVDAQKIAGPDNNEYGVICRLKDEANFYLFSISSDGYYGIWKKIDDVWSEVGGADGGFDDKVIQLGNVSNHLKITCNKGNLTLEVNGSILMDVVDTDLTYGDVALYVSTFDKPGVDILFDNFVITKP